MAGPGQFHDPAVAQTRPRQRQRPGGTAGETHFPRDFRTGDAVFAQRNKRGRPAISHEDRTGRGQDQQNGGEPESLVELALLVNLQAVRLVRIYQEALHDETHGAEIHNRLLVVNAKEYIDLQCGRDCSIDLLAKRVGCSRTHFTRIFRRHAGCSVLEYINRQRLKHYNSMRPDTPVKIFAEELGFSSASAFIHWRKQNVKADCYVNYTMLTKQE